MSVQAAANGIPTADRSHDHGVGHPPAPAGPGGASATPSAHRSPDGAVHVDVQAAISNENAASSASTVTDLAAAATLVKQLASQMADQPASLSSAQSTPLPQAVLSLIG